jgi:hypothetical protein
VDKELVGTGRFELEPNCGRERGKAERESAGEILTLSLSKGPMARGSKDLTLPPLAGAFICAACATLHRFAFGVLAVG